MEFCPGADERLAESLWERIKGQAIMADIVLGVCYRPPDQEEDIDEASFRQLQVTSQSQALVLMGDFNHPDVCWEDHTARHKQSRRFLKCIGHNFLTEVVEKPLRTSWRCEGQGQPWLQ